jgi:hypothetical protein
MTTEARMNEPSPIRGRWTLVANDRTGEVFDVVRNEVIGRGMRSAGWLMIEVVPVPDEQAIERGAKALARRYGEEVGFADWLGIARTVASALEPPE